MLKLSRRVFFHIHTWKTGGSTFLNICRNNFGPNFHRDIMLVQQWFLSPDQIRWLLNYHKWIRCYSCHMISGDLPYDYLDAEVIGIAFVRKPVDRFVSSFKYMKDKNYRGGFHKNVSFNEIFSRTFIEVDNPWWRNGQTHVLSGQISNRDALRTIIKLVEKGRLILLVTERYDESCIVLEKLFPIEFKDCSYVKYNVSPMKIKLDERQHKAVAEYVKLDNKLHKIANQILDSELERLFPQPKEKDKYLSAFKEKCRKKQRNHRISNKLNSFENALKKSSLNHIKKLMKMK